MSIISILNIIYSQNNMLPVSCRSKVIHISHINSLIIKLRILNIGQKIFKEDFRS